MDTPSSFDSSAPVDPSEPHENVAPRQEEEQDTESSEGGSQQQPLTSFTVILTLVLIGLTIRWWHLTHQRPEPLFWENAEGTPLFQVDVNEATWVEWIQLRGIGVTLAHRIVADREFNGPFESIDDVQRVEGIGPVTLQEIRPALTMKDTVSQPLTTD